MLKTMTCKNVSSSLELLLISWVSYLAQLFQHRPVFLLQLVVLTSECHQCPPHPLKQQYSIYYYERCKWKILFISIQGNLWRHFVESSSVKLEQNHRILAFGHFLMPNPKYFCQLGTSIISMRELFENFKQLELWVYKLVIFMPLSAEILHVLLL